MGVEAFDTGEGFDRGQRLSQRLLVHAYDAGAALELVGAEAGEGFAGAAGGQGVAWARDEIADGDGGERTDVDGARGADFFSPRILILDDER